MVSEDFYWIFTAHLPEDVRGALGGHIGSRFDRLELGMASQCIGNIEERSYYNLS